MAPTRATALETLLWVAIELTGEHDHAALLDRIVDGTAAVVGARYAALAVYDADGNTIRFVHHGVDDSTASEIGRTPRAVGLLAASALASGPVRVDDVASDPRFGGFPPGHPTMGPFLGAPVGRSGQHLGNLYAARQPGAPSFDAADEAHLMALAAFAASAIETHERLDLERQRADSLAAQARAEEAERLQRRMWAAVVAAQEAERARVARDLHDDIGQALTSVLLGLRLLDGAGDTGVVELRDLVADALRRTRQLAFDLRPTVLDDVGLGPALVRLGGEVAARSGLHVDVAVEGVPPSDELPAEVATVVYRVVQEALTNVVRHARASTVTVTVGIAGHRLRAVVDDDGIGFDVDRHRGELGLRGMEERAQLTGGTLGIASSPAGTRVELELPA